MSRTGLADTLHQRGRFRSLFVDGPRCKRDVVDGLAVSRSTVDRTWTRPRRSSPRWTPTPTSTAG